MLQKVVMMACLLTTLIADTSVTFQCRNNGHGNHLFATGDGFSGSSLPIDEQKFCRLSGGSTKTTYNFTCTSQCESGCMAFTDDPSFNPQICTSTIQGSWLVALLETYYNFEKNDLTYSSSYPWCPCQAYRPKGTIWVIMLLLVLMGGAAASFYLFYWKKLKQRDRAALSAIIDHYQLQ